jgi:hypothetical protein
MDRLARAAYRLKCFKSRPVQPGLFLDENGIKHSSSRANLFGATPCNDVHGLYTRAAGIGKHGKWRQRRRCGGRNPGRMWSDTLHLCQVHSNWASVKSRPLSESGFRPPAHCSLQAVQGFPARVSGVPCPRPCRRRHGRRRRSCWTCTGHTSSGTRWTENVNIYIYPQ